MGRKRKSAKLQLAEGDTRQRGKHKLEQAIGRTPPTTSGIPDCPKHLRGRARETWEFWRVELIGMQIDSRCDGRMLEGACIAYARAVDADLIIAREPVYFQGKRKAGLYRTKKHPAVTVSNAAWSQVKAFCSEFGLSPASRARLSIAPASETREDVNAVLSGPTLTDQEKQSVIEMFQTVVANG